MANGNCSETSSTLICLLNKVYITDNVSNKLHEKSNKISTTSSLCNQPSFCYAKLSTGSGKAYRNSCRREGTPEYFLLRPELAKAYGYCHAVRIGDNLIISGAVSMADAGNLTAPGDMAQQMKNCYENLKKILDHYGYSINDDVVENVFTTSMEEFINVSSYRNSIYTKQFPTGSWMQVSGLVLPGQLIEIEWEAHNSN